MEYTKLGNTDLKVSRICLGCMGFGNAATGQHSWTVDEDSSRAIIKRALELGINFFDTAIAYQNGTSEEYLGRAVKDFTKRDKVVIATKFLPRSSEEIAAGVSGQTHIERQLDLSLSHLGMDYVDLYIYHMWDYQTKAVELKLTPEDISYLEELYVPHALVGVMAQNKMNANKDNQVWMKNAPKN